MRLNKFVLCGLLAFPLDKAIAAESFSEYEEAIETLENARHDLVQRRESIQTLIVDSSQKLEVLKSGGITASEAGAKFLSKGEADGFAKEELTVPALRRLAKRSDNIRIDEVMMTVKPEIQKCSLEIGNSDANRMYPERIISLPMGNSNWQYLSFVGDVDDNDRIWGNHVCPW